MLGIALFVLFYFGGAGDLKDPFASEPAPAGASDLKDPFASVPPAPSVGSTGLKDPFAHPTRCIDDLRQP